MTRSTDITTQTTAMMMVVRGFIVAFTAQ